MMTRKNYGRLAHELLTVMPNEATMPREMEQWWQCVDAVARVLEEDNPNFDWDQFSYACSHREEV